MHPSASTSDVYRSFADHMQRLADIRYASAVLQWDQETYLPRNGASARARQLATLSELAHEAFTSEKLGALLQELQSRDLDEPARTNVRLTWEEYEKQKRYSSRFVRQLSEAVSAAYYGWMEARQQNQYSVYRPAFGSLLELKKQESDIIGYEGHPYNAHLREYEKSASVTLLDQLFANLVSPLKELIAAVQPLTAVDDSFLEKHYPRQQQWEWGMYLVDFLGFDLGSGRQDISEHPFTTSFSPKDVRITTRIDENDFRNMTWSCIHEVGHALYEQGLPESDYGLPSGEFASLSIHESQSRLWENCIGRNLPLWQYLYPQLQRYFPEQLGTVALHDFIRAVNKVQPSLIRTEADELTYHFHIIIRYTIEKELLAGELKPDDLPDRWNGLYRELLGVEVPDDKRGCLQDVHWSHGSFGYFPTYSLGSFYAAQFYQAARPVLGLDERLRNGDPGSLLHWLRENIHRQGRRYTSEELCRRVTGSPLDVAAFLRYARDKFETLG